MVSAVLAAAWLLASAVLSLPVAVDHEREMNTTALLAPAAAHFPSRDSTPPAVLTAGPSHEHPVDPQHLNGSALPRSTEEVLLNRWRRRGDYPDDVTPQRLAHCHQAVHFTHIARSKRDATMTGGSEVADLDVAVEEPCQPRGIMLISLGRSGTTAFAHMLSALPSSFSYFEPYKRFVDENNRTALALADLFTCRVFDAPHDVFYKVFWEYACSNLPYAANNKTWRSRCIEEVLSEQERLVMKRDCLRSKYRIVKTIRLGPNVDEDMVAVGRTEGLQVSVVHMVRSPFDVAVSQFVLWLKFPDDKLDDPHAVTTYFKEWATVLCHSSCLTVLELLRASSQSQLHVLELPHQYIIGNWHDVGNRVFGLLNIPVKDRPTRKDIEVLQKRSYAHFGSLPGRLDTLKKFSQELEETRLWIRNQPTCKAIYEGFQLRDKAEQVNAKY